MYFKLNHNGIDDSYALSMCNNSSKKIQSAEYSYVRVAVDAASIFGKMRIPILNILMAVFMDNLPLTNNQLNHELE